jgi:hypothetical protein
MKVGLENQNVIEFPRKPVAVTETPVYNLDAARQSRQAVTSGEKAPQCVNGVCQFDWKPKKPAA